MNKYLLPFGAFCGVNHLYQTVFFASAFLFNESVEFFEWLFMKFIECFGKESPALMTNQDPAMALAIRKVFKGTIHCFCIWHIMQKLPIKIAGGSMKGEIIKEINKLVYESKSINKFEEDWTSMISKFDLGNNE